MRIPLLTSVLEWWASRPLGYSELHAPLSLTRDEFKAWVRLHWSHKLPKDPRARNFRVQFLAEDHCMYKRSVNHMDHRPNIKPFTCRRHGQ